MSYASRSGQTLSGSTSLALTHIVTPEQFAVNQRRLEDAKAVLTSYQASNEQGLEAYMRLQQSIEEGERAKELLNTVLQSSQSTLPVPAVASSYQQVGRSSNNMHTTTAIEEVITPSAAYITPVTGSSNAAMITTSEHNLRQYTSGRQQRSDLRELQSSIKQPAVNPTYAPYANRAQPTAPVSFNPGSWYPEQSRDQRPPNYPAQPFGSSIHTVHTPQAQSSSLHGALGQSSQFTLANTREPSAPKSVVLTQPATKTVSPTPNSLPQPQSSQATGPATTSLSANLSSTSHPPPLEITQNSRSVLASKSLLVTNGVFLTTIRAWSLTIPPRTSVPVPYSNLWVSKDDDGKVDIFCMAEPRSITPKRSAPSKPFVYIDLTGNFQYFDKPPGSPLHYYPPAQPKPLPQYGPVSQTGIGTSIQNAQETDKPPPSSVPQPMGSSLSALPLPATPVSQKPSGPRTPAQARKTHLAKDILRALGVSWTTESSKRQRTEDSDPDSSRRGASKKQVIEAGLEDRVQSLSLEVVPAYTPPPQAPPASASYTQSYVASSHSGLVAANNVEDGQVALTDTPSKIATPTIDASINETVPEASESPTAVPLHKPSEDLNAAAKQNGLGAVEREAVELSRSRLREQLCKWKGCEVVLNSTESLWKHVVEHAQDDELSGMYCMWEQCVGGKFSDRGKFTNHIQSHARACMFCAYRDCDKWFRKPGELVKHHVLERSENSLLRPFAGPFKPHLPSSPSEVPRILPSYLVEARSVRGAAISRDRHTMLGPWVLRNICGPVDLGSRKNGVSAPQGTGFYEYDFLASKSTHKTPRLEDIDSVEVSSLIHSGFIFWNPEDVEPRNDWCPSPGRSAIADPVEKDDVPDFQWSEATLAPLSRAESEKAAEFAPSEEDAVVMILDASSGSLNSGPEGNAAG